MYVISKSPSKFRRNTWEELLDKNNNTPRLQHLENKPCTKSNVGFQFIHFEIFIYPSSAAEDSVMHKVQARAAHDIWRWWWLCIVILYCYLLCLHLSRYSHYWMIFVRKIGKFFHRKLQNCNEIMDKKFMQWSKFWVNRPNVIIQVTGNGN